MKMKTISLIVLLFAIQTFGQFEQFDFFKPGISKVQNTTIDSQYALQYASGFPFVLGGLYSYNLSPDGSQNIRNNSTTMGLDDSTFAYYYFDSAYVANNNPSDSIAKDISVHGKIGR